LDKKKRLRFLVSFWIRLHSKTSDFLQIRLRNFGCEWSATSTNTIQKHIRWSRLFILIGAKRISIVLLQLKRFIVEQNSHHKYSEDVGGH